MKNDKKMTKNDTMTKFHEPEKTLKIVKNLGFLSFVCHFSVIFLSCSYQFLQFLMMFFNCLIFS